MPAASATAVNRSPIICAENGTTRSAGLGLVAERADGARGAVLQVADIIRFAHLVRLAAADGDEDAISVAGVRPIRPPQGGDLATAAARP